MPQYHYDHGGISSPLGGGDGTHGRGDDIYGERDGTHGTLQEEFWYIPLPHWESTHHLGMQQFKSTSL